MVTKVVQYEFGTDIYDLRSDTTYGIDRIDLVGLDLSGGTAQWSSVQFGSQISNSTVFSRSGEWSVELYVESGATFSAAGWLADNYPVFGQMFHFLDTNSTTREIITGSRYSDEILTYGGGDALRGGQGNDVLSFYQGVLGAGASFDGGAGRDELKLLLSDYDDNVTTDFSLVTVSGIEALTFSTYVGSGGAGGPTDSHVTFSAAQFATIKTVTVAIDHAELTVKGSVVDLSDVAFVRKPGPDLSTGEIVVNIVGAGNSSVLTGSPIDDTITASPKGSRMTGGLGADYLRGAAGNDTFVITARDAAEGDIAFGGDGGIDTIEFQSSADGDVFAMSFGYMNIVRFTGGFDSTVVADAQAFRFITGSRIVGSSARDSLVLSAVNHYDTWFDDLVFQNWSADDSVTIVLAGQSQVKGTQVSDSVQGSAGDDYLYGVGGSDTLNGSSGDDSLNGGSGNDTLIGGGGNDTYFYAAGDTIIEAANAGIDTIQTAVAFSLASQPNIENVVLTGSAAVNATGNDLDNALTGNSAANRLNGGNGNDTLYGAGGVDTLIGGGGNDLYVNPAGDVITEGAGAGRDQVSSNATFDLGTTPYIEDLTLTGSSAIDGFGNAFANVIIGNSKANHLTGLGNNDSLDGGSGNDTLEGGDGNDLYINPTGDTIVEAAGSAAGAHDRVESDVNFNLSGVANVEDLTLSGNGAINGFGNSLSNIITGNDAANTLKGGGGGDSLIGGGGSDILNGEAGPDTLIGGAGQDTVVTGNDTAKDVVRVSSAADSSSLGYDILSGFDFDHDKLDLSAVPTAVNGFSTSSPIRAAFFDSDVAAAVNGFIGDGLAAVFASTAGDYVGVVFLVVDANGVAGYQAGEDYVFRLINSSGSIDPGDFI